MEKNENERYYKLGNNGSVDSSLLRNEALAFTTDRRRKKNIYRWWKDYSFLPLFRVLTYSNTAPIQASPSRLKKMTYIGNIWTGNFYFSELTSSIEKCLMYVTSAPTTTLCLLVTLPHVITLFLARDVNH